MNILSLLAGLSAMFGWGTADFLAAKAAKKIGAFRTLFVQQSIGLIPFFIISIFIFELPVLSWKTFAIFVFASLLHLISYLSFFKGFEKGKVSLIAPVAACWAAVTSLLSIFFLNESITLPNWIGIIFAVLGAVLVSFKLKDILSLEFKKSSKGISYAFIAMFGWGISYVLFALLINELSWFIPFFIVRILIVAYMVPFAARTKFKIKNRIWIFLILAAFFDAAAFLSYGYGAETSYNSLMAPLAAMFPAVTLIWARIFLKEKLSINQILGFASVILGLVFLAL